MKEVSIPFTEAKSHLSKYGRLAEQGQTTLVLKHHRSAFLIAPVPQHERVRQKTPGLVIGRIHMMPDFDVTSEETIADFEGSP